MSFQSSDTLLARGGDREPLMSRRGSSSQRTRLRLDTKQGEGGRGLGSVRATVQDKTTKIRKYIRKMAPEEELLSEYLRQQKPNNAAEKGEPSQRDKPTAWHGPPAEKKTLIPRNPPRGWNKRQIIPKNYVNSHLIQMKSIRLTADVYLQRSSCWAPRSSSSLRRAFC